MTRKNNIPDISSFCRLPQTEPEDQLRTPIDSESTYLVQHYRDTVENFWIVLKFTLNCMLILNSDDIMSDP